MGPHDEPVELGLGERVGPLGLHRVLGRDHEERAGSGWVVPSIVTCDSCIASRRAAWVLAGARLISSASTLGEHRSARNVGWPVLSRSRSRP